MKYRVYSCLLFFCLTQTWAQNRLAVEVRLEDPSLKEISIKIYDKANGFVKQIQQGEEFVLESEQVFVDFVFLAEGFAYLEQEIDFSRKDKLNIVIPTTVETLNEVVLDAKRKEVFTLKRMQDFEKTAIYAGKKTEVILVQQSMANLAANNARQIFNQVPGLNIYQNDDAGLQLHIGGRGLDPNRTSNFNTRQNGYDISADVLGYPESYYTPPAEAIEEIQIIRGAASLQYGTQFGGLINFKLKESSTYKPLKGVTRNTLGSNGLYTNYTQLEGKLGKWRYIGYFNVKKGKGFRPNSSFESSNVYFKTSYKIAAETTASVELTYLDYLAQQAGGLTDQLFAVDPFQSNRERNWFGLYWLLYNVKLEHAFSENSNFSLNLFGLDAQRNAVGFRSNRVSQIDPNEERDLIKGDFNNYGLEARWLYNYTLSGKELVFLLGGKYYKAKNTSVQGPGSANSNADFSFYRAAFPNYNQQSEYIYPNKNLAFFAENIFYLNDKLSITPGLRFENIRTATDGEYQRINTDAAGNVILNETLGSAESRNRSFVLLGMGLSYRFSPTLELYGNGSKNYRSITFTDISIINPAYTINPNISDEKGFTADIGVRGNFKELFSFDANFFHLNYQDRIGFIQKAYRDGSVKSERGNVGDAQLSGLEVLVDVNFAKWLHLDTQKIRWNSFINYAYIESQYTTSEIPGIVGKKVEFVPTTNLKTGIRVGYNNLALNLQYSYISSQFTDSSNAVKGSISGVIGQIPAYGLLDFSGSYTLNRFKFEFGVNNLLNEAYFTRRATGYPGPGIIPSPNRNLYITTQFSF
jgi:Fe(3+) dicitrate transport protein